MFGNFFKRDKRRLTEEQYVEKLRVRGIDEQTGQFIVDGVPMEPPIGYKKHPSMVEIVREQIRSAKLAEAAEAAGMETFEEADDFDCGPEDGEDLRSGYENDFDPPLTEVAKEVAAEKEREKKRQEDEAARKRREEREERRDRFYSQNEPPLRGGTPPARP